MKRIGCKEANYEIFDYDESKEELSMEYVLKKIENHRGRIQNACKDFYLEYIENKKIKETQEEPTKDFLNGLKKTTRRFTNNA